MLRSVPIARAHAERQRILLGPGEDAAPGRRSREGGGGINWCKPEDSLMSILTGDAPWEVQRQQIDAAQRHHGNERPLEEPGPDPPAAAASLRERTEARCQRELDKMNFEWAPITMETVKAGHDKVAPGMFYGIEFPWSASTLMEMGPQWLTRAFHLAGTLDTSNWVKKIALDQKVKITGGNNGGKFLFEVTYGKPAPDLHTQLFAKVPFPLTGATFTDRLSSSVYKQPMDALEVNTYRCLEASLPVRIPRFYYGEVSNETSNFILITEQIRFRGLPGAGGARLGPLDIEGPYDKCKDFQLGGRDREYYMLLMGQLARLAAAHKRGAIPWRYGEPPREAWQYGLNLGTGRPQACTGENPLGCARKLEAALQFMSKTAPALYPAYVSDPPFQRKFMDVMLKLNAYSAELSYWKHSNPDYSALGHQNLNTDNAYFWRDRNGELDCGIFDFGGFGVSSLPHKIWWSLNMAEFDQVKANLDDYIESFIATYREHGGPQLDARTVKLALQITALQNCMIMVSAIPNSLKMCPAKEFLTIRDRHDPRIADNVDNKSTLRSCLHVLNMTVRMLEELRCDEALEGWVRDVWVGELGQAPKTEAEINDPDAGSGTTRW